MEIKVIQGDSDDRRSEGRALRTLVGSRLARLSALALTTWTVFGAARCEAQAAAPLPGNPASVPKEALTVSVGDNDLGVARANGYGLARDDRLALDLFARACAGGLGDGCSNQGALLERGRGAPVDIEEALRLYRRACEGGSAIGCSNLGALYLDTLGDTADLTYSRQLFAWACERGSASGCENRVALEHRRAPKLASRN
jgi:TPR repeat protein